MTPYQRDKQLQTSLNPHDHADSVRTFLDFFGLTPRKPDHVTLQEILERFAGLPYENISKIISLNECECGAAPAVRLPETVMEDYARFHLGGTCFSLTFFLQTILTRSGFDCYPVMADMKAGTNIHCCLVVILDAAKYLLDPGYLLTRPMEINPAKPRLFRSEFTGVELRFDRQTNWYHLFTFNQDERKWRYRFQDRPVPPEEFLQHWLASFRKNSMHNICLTRVTRDGLLYVQKYFMRETTFAGKRNFNIRQNYHAVLHDQFGIDRQIVEQAQAALADNLRKERESGLWAPRI